ncbi:F0F1 ATP synthase subunit B' [Amaricoccus sp.]|uniref:F0F1 ATP synthase subunit B' n=1 Tax=Amaricoccus sp. TaxID=1872485 RepID=UPI0026188C8C|nr:F0F1 ATP synthase subunit B' [Amaricoccus sp.]HRO11715.1 F0F1 ATP synthase subunit B' [Amaricoccus sp.]
MATENAVIVIAQAEGDQVEVAPAGDAHAEGHTAETLGADNLAHAESGMPQLNPAIYPNLLFWLVLALLALYFILSKVALPRIGTVMTERNDAISNDIEQAALLKRRAQEAEASYNAALAKARDEAHRIAAEAKAAIDKELAGLMAKADAEIAVKSAESEKRIAEIREGAAKSVEEVARETAVAIVDALMPGTADARTVHTAISRRLKG